MQQHRLTIRTLLTHLTLRLLLFLHLTLTISTLLTNTLLALTNLLDFLLNFLILILIAATGQFITKVHIVVVISFIQT